MLSTQTHADSSKAKIPRFYCAKIEYTDLWKAGYGETPAEATNGQHFKKCFETAVLETCA